MFNIDCFLFLSLCSLRRLVFSGIFYWADGDIYEGGFVEDLRHGYGIYLYANGDKYQGEWF